MFTFPGQQVTDWSEVIELEGSFEELNGNVSNADSERSLFEEQYEKDDHDKVHLYFPQMLHHISKNTLYMQILIMNNHIWHLKTWS